MQQRYKIQAFGTLVAVALLKSVGFGDGFIWVKVNLMEYLYIPEY